MGSSPQPHDLFIHSPVISAYSAVRYVPDRRLRSTVSRLISDYQPLSASLNDFITTGQPLDQHLEAALSSPNQLRDQSLLTRILSTCQPYYQHLSATLSAPVNCFISDHIAA